MPAYSFRPIFVAPILSGRKAQTIRAERRGIVPHAHEGQTLSLYTGMRTRACRLILKTLCTGTVPVVLRWRPVMEVTVDDERLQPSAHDAFAQADGFADFLAMAAFWDTYHPTIELFRGVLSRWRAPAEPVEIGTDITGAAP